MIIVILVKHIKVFIRSGSYAQYIHVYIHISIDDILCYFNSCQKKLKLPQNKYTRWVLLFFYQKKTHTSRLLIIRFISNEHLGYFVNCWLYFKTVVVSKIQCCCDLLLLAQTRKRQFTHGGS